MESFVIICTQKQITTQEILMISNFVYLSFVSIFQIVYLFLKRES